MQFYSGSGIVPIAYPFGNYMTFLRNYNLIDWRLVDGGTDAAVFLTGTGRRFLEYITAQNYNILERPF